MFSSFFGSFSKRTFCDLFDLNVRSSHMVLNLYEIMDKEIINHKVIDLPILEELEDGFVPSCFKKIKNSSYMLGLLSHDSNKINNLMVDKYNKAHLLDTTSDKSLEYCVERHKEFIYVVLTENIVSIHLGPKQRFYVDGFGSISETPMSEYEEMRAKEIYYLDISNIKKD